jgi:hypothetical protein
MFLWTILYLTNGACYEQKEKERGSPDFFFLFLGIVSLVIYLLHSIK